MGSIRVDIDDLLERLKDMSDNEFSIVELVIDDNYYGGSSLKLKAIDISEEEDTDYGEIGDVSDEFGI